MPLYRDEGVVLRTYKLGEADRIVVLLTRGRGKVRAVAKGVRKTSSRFGARLEPGQHVAVLCYEGRQLDVINQADTIESFRAVRDDLDRLARSACLLEAVDHLTAEAQESPRLYAMLLGALRSLAESDSPVLVGAFYLRLLAEEGLAPETEVCVACGSDGPLEAIDLDEGGVLCRSCRRGRPIGPEALALVRLIMGGDVRSALAAPASPATAEVEGLATLALEHHVERRLRSVGVLDRG